ASISSIEDPLIHQLLKYKEMTDQRSDSKAGNKEEVWGRIKQVTQPTMGSGSVKRVINIPTVSKWAIAASILIAALVGMFYFTFHQETGLIAQSSSLNKVVQLDDGSKVTLRPHSKLLALRKNAQSERYRLIGEGYFEVVHKPERVFSVETENGIVSVLGTRFILSTWGRKMQVYLEEGSVKVEATKRDSTVFLRPGESTSIDENGSISSVHSVNATEFTDWLNRKLIFDSKSAEFVAEELEQQFNISISLPDNISGMMLTGSLSLEDLQASLDDLGLVMGGKFIKKGNRSYVFEPR
ncbi:MAG: FecR domain-containing protein, partial [Balneolaceae bacterium]